MCEMYAPESVFASNLEHALEHAYMCVISSNVGALLCLWIIALLRSFGSRHTLRVPLALLRYVSKLNQHINSTFWVPSCMVISLSVVSIYSLASMETLHLLCCTGGKLGTSRMEFCLTYCLSFQRNLGTCSSCIYCEQFYGLLMVEQLLYGL